MNVLSLKASPRSLDEGKRELRKLRKSGFVPASLFGIWKGKRLSLPFALSLKDVEKQGFTYSRGIQLDLEGESYPVLMKESQFHPITQELLHLDFFIAENDQIVKSHVPLRFSNLEERCAKIGLVLKHKRSLYLRARKKSLPEMIEVDAENDLEVGRVVRLKELGLSDQLQVLNCEPHGPVAAIVKH